MGPTQGEQARERSLVVVTDDDRAQCMLLRTLLQGAGHTVEVFHDGESFLDALTRLLPDCVCLDLVMPGLSGLEVLERLKARQSRLPVIMLTADGSVENVVEAMRLGAFDYLIKPVERTKFLAEVHNAVEHHRLQQRLVRLEREARGRSYAGLVGSGPAMQELFAELDRVAASDVTVLVHGESGTGKELVARAIHDHGSRHAGPYLALNCAAITDELMESELFGHEKGAFTHAVGRHIGLMERADGGTLVLDEIGELRPGLQAKLLRALQERRFRRVGSTEEISSDFRLVAATNRDLEAEVRAGRFREDLYFRIAVFDLRLPPLRARLEDLPVLVRHFTRELAELRSVPPVECSADALALMMRYPWPGNVRELRNAVERALVVCDGQRILPRDLPPRLQPDAAPTPHAGTATPATAAAPAAPAGDESLDLQQLERRAIEEALRRTAGNLARAARLLGIGRTTLYRKLREYGLGNRTA
jgi:DNA-binding NtrC family response regulator